MSNFIRASKCVIGKTYYLSGDCYEYNLIPISEPPYVVSKNNIPLINTPVIFVGKVHEKSGSYNGKHRFEFSDGSGRYVQTYAHTDFLIEPIENPEILNTD